MILREIKTNSEHYFRDQLGRYQGEYKRWYDNGQLMTQRYYADGELHGEAKYWWSNGHLMEISHYVDGKLQGEAKDWYSNGQIRTQRYYVDDKLHGEFKSWHSNGRCTKHCIYVNGEQLDVKPYNLNADQKLLLVLKHNIKFLNN